MTLQTNDPASELALPSGWSSGNHSMSIPHPPVHPRSAIIRRICKQRFSVVILITAAVLLACDNKGPADHAVRAMRHAKPRELAVSHGKAAQPNVVVILLDTVRADRLSVYGYGRNTTPFLREFAHRGVTFTAAYTQGLWTRTAVPSLLTSSYVTEHANVSTVPPVDQLPACAPDLPSILHRAGYHTVAFTGLIWPGSFYVGYGWQRGFDRVIGDWYSSTTFDAGPHDANLETLTPDFVRQLDVNTVRAFEDWLSPTASRPFFAHLHLLGAHGPYEAAPEYGAGLIDQKNAKRFLNQFAHSYKWNKSRAAEHPDELQYIRDAYDATVRFSDRNVEHVVNALRVNGLLDNTIVVVLADHGENFLEDGVDIAWLHGSENPPREPITRIPLIISGPGVPRDVRIGDDAMLIDVAPTILASVGIEAPRDMRGINLFDSRRLRERAASISEGDFVCGVKSVRSGPWKLVRINPDSLVTYYSRAHYGGETLVNTSLDPTETVDFSFNHPEEVNRLRTILDREVLRGESGWHVRLEDDSSRANYEVRLKSGQPLKRLSVNYFNPESGIDLPEMQRRSILGNVQQDAVIKSDEPVKFAGTASQSLPDNSIVAFGAWARVTGGARSFKIQLSWSGPSVADAVLTGHGPRDQWTPVWGYAAANGVPTLELHTLPGRGRVEFRAPFVALLSHDTSSLKMATEMHLPIRISSGSADVVFDTAKKDQRIEVEVLKDGQPLDDRMIVVGTGHRSRNPLRAAPHEVFIAPSDLRTRKFKRGTVAIYYSGCCPGTDSLGDSEAARENVRRLRALGYVH